MRVVQRVRCNEQMGGGGTMRTFSPTDAGPDQFEEGTEIEKISNEVSDNWTSTVFKMEEGKMIACDCNMDDFEITQVYSSSNM